MPYFHYLSPNNFNFFIGLKSWISIQFWFEVFFFPFCTFIFPVRSVSIYFNIALSKISHINLIFNFSSTKIFALKCFPTNLNFFFFVSSYLHLFHFLEWFSLFVLIIGSFFLYLFCVSFPFSFPSFFPSFFPAYSPLLVYPLHFLFLFSTSCFSSLLLLPLLLRSQSSCK